MRIIAGQRRGHKLESPAKRVTRPTSDMVREAIFNILGDQVDDREVVDLCSGTGALALEALSRGARHALLIERDRANLEVIRRNIAHLRYEDRAHPLLADAYRWMKQFTPIDSTPLLVFLDPPYRDYQQHPTRLAASLAHLADNLPPQSILIVEGPDHGTGKLLPASLDWDIRHYASSIVAIGTTRETTALDPGPPPDAD